MTDTLPPLDCPVIALKEGMHITFDRCTFSTPRNLFILTLVSSAMIGGKPVHCAGLLPGISLRIHTWHDMPHVQYLAAPLWEQVQYALGQWIDIAVHRPCMTLPADNTDIALALDAHATLDKGALQFTVLPVWARPAATSHPA